MGKKAGGKKRGISGRELLPLRMQRMEAAPHTSAQQHQPQKCCSFWGSRFKSLPSASSHPKHGRNCPPLQLPPPQQRPAVTPKPEKNQPPRSLARPRLCHGEKLRQSSGKGWEGLTLPAGPWSTTGTSHCWARVSSHRDTHLALVRRARQAPCPRLCHPQPPPQRDGCTGMDGLHPALLFPQALLAPAAVPSHEHLPKGENQPPLEGWQSSATQSFIPCQACAMAQGIAPSDTAESAPVPFHQPRHLSSQGKLPLTQLGDFRAFGEKERASRDECPFPRGHLQGQGCLPGAGSSPQPSCLLSPSF